MAWLNLPQVNHKLTREQRQLFNEDIRKTQIRSSRLFTITILLLSLFFLIPDAYFLPDHFSSIASLRIIVVFSGILGTLFIHRMNIYYAYLLLSASIILYNLLVVYVSILLANIGNYSYQHGTVLLIIFCCTLFQAPLLLTAFITTLCWSTYLIGTLTLSTADLSVIVNNTTVFFIAACLGLLSVAHRERYLLGFFLSTQRLKEQEKTTKLQSLTDALTTLPNRLSIMNKMEQYDHYIPENMLVMMADVDNFKRLNDQYGHKIGDIALKLIAQSLKNSVQDKDGYVSRYGGEEFMILLENTTMDDGQKVGDLLVESIRDITHPELPKMSISIGGYITTGNETSLTDCIERADQTLLKAKTEGKDRFLLNRREYSK